MEHIVLEDKMSKLEGRKGLGCKQGRGQLRDIIKTIKQNQTYSRGLTSDKKNYKKLTYNEIFVAWFKLTLISYFTILLPIADELCTSQRITFSQPLALWLPTFP